MYDAHRYWSTRFNARVSDWIRDRACLLRIDPVHHKLAVFQGDRPGLCHMNFQVDTIDDVFRNWHFLVDHGVQIEMGPGRHPQSTAIFLYFLGPEGFTYEYSFGVRRIEDDASWRAADVRPGRARLDRHVAGPDQAGLVPAATPARVGPRAPRITSSRNPTASRVTSVT